MIFRSSGLVLAASLALVVFAPSVVEAAPPPAPAVESIPAQAKLPAPDAARINAALKAADAKLSAAEKDKRRAQLENKKTEAPVTADGKKVTKGSVVVLGLGPKRKPHTISFEARQALKKGGFALGVTLTDAFATDGSATDSKFVTTILIDDELGKISFQPQGAAPVNVQVNPNGTFDVEGVSYPNAEDAAVAAAYHPSLRNLSREAFAGLKHALENLSPVTKYPIPGYGTSTPTISGGLGQFFGGVYGRLGGGLGSGFGGGCSYCIYY